MNPHPLTADERKQITAIYEKYNGVVNKIATRFAENHAEKDELVAKYWLFFCEKRLFLSYSPDKGTLRQFLNTTARNKFIDIGREQTRWTKNYDMVPIDDREDSKDGDVVSSDALPVDHNSDPLMDILKSEVATTVTAAVKRLPRRQRQAIELKYFRGLSVQETAGTLGIGEASVKTHLSKGRKTLRKTLSPLYSLYKTLK